MTQSNPKAVCLPVDSNGEEILPQLVAGYAIRGTEAGHLYPIKLDADEVIVGTRRCSNYQTRIRLVPRQLPVDPVVRRLAEAAGLEDKEGHFSAVVPDTSVVEKLDFLRRLFPAS